MTRTRTLAAAALAAALIPALAGCFSGQAATTQVQSTMNTGNGTQARIGDIRVENATLVLGPEGSRSATLVVSFVGGPEEDTLLSVDIAGKPAYITGQTAVVPRGGIAAFGWNSAAWINAYDFEAPASGYVPVRITMEKSGIRQIEVLTVPAAGYYSGIAPNPATAPLA